MRQLFIIITAFLGLGLCASATPTFVLDATTLYGLPGDTVGIGFTLTSTPDFDNINGQVPFLVITNAEFVLDVEQFPVGVFTPFITLPQNFVVIGPNAFTGEVNPLAQHFDLVLMLGVGSYEINSFQSIGDSASGQIILTYDVYRFSPNDPTFDPTTDTLYVGQQVFANLTVVVGTEPVPEPSSAMLVITGLGFGIAAWRRKRRGPTGYFAFGRRAS